MFNIKKGEKDNEEKKVIDCNYYNYYCRYIVCYKKF